MKKFIIVLFGLIFMTSPLVAATFTEYEKKNTEIRVGRVQYENFSMEKLLDEKANIEEEYQRATNRYNNDLTKINRLITEAQRLGL